jgi:hypothetical protein
MLTPRPAAQTDQRRRWLQRKLTYKLQETSDVICKPANLLMDLGCIHMVQLDKMVA